MNLPYVDCAPADNTAKFTGKLEFSIHGLTSDHLSIICQAVEQFSKIANSDVDILTKEILDLSSKEFEMLADYCSFRKSANDLVIVIKEAL